MLKHLCYYSLFLIFFSCEKDSKITEVNQNTTGIYEVDSTSEVSEKLSQKQTQTYQADFLPMENVLINGHKILLEEKEFLALYPAFDSIVTDLRECGHPLEWLDEKWMLKTYGAKDDYVGTFANFDGNITRYSTSGLNFDSNKHRVIFDSGKAQGNSFTILTNHIVLNEKTSVADFKKLFPKVKMEETDDENVVRFRLYLAGSFDESFIFDFKNGVLDHYTLWWLLC